MIPYEELCEALERHTRRQHNQAELDQLNAGEPTQRASSGAETHSRKPNAEERGFATEPPEVTHEIDVLDDVVVDER